MKNPNFACQWGPALDYCYRSVARQPTGENTPVPANRSKTVAVTLRLFRSIVTAPLCHLSWRGSGVNQLSRFSCHPFSLHPTRKRTQITALPAILPPYTHAGVWLHATQSVHACGESSATASAFTCGVKSIPVWWGVITAEVFVRTDEQLRASAFIKASGLCCMCLFTLVVFDNKLISFFLCYSKH